MVLANINQNPSNRLSTFIGSQRTNEFAHEAGQIIQSTTCPGNQALK